MLLAALNSVEKVYGDQVVLDGANLELRANSRTALIGRNGSGKSTILNLLMGEVKPDKGTIFRADEVRLALLEQGPTFEPGNTVVQVADRAFAELDALELHLNKLETAGLDDPDRYHEWESLHAAFERRGGYARRARRDGVLSSLGFAKRHDQPVQQLSGGERTRLGLAQLLMAQPDVLLLDEPTNHLDMEMRAWLEGYLARYPGAALVVSHDRAFLDGACNQTAEVSRGTLRVGPGNPSAYRVARAEAERIQAATRAGQERELERLSAGVEQMRRWAAANSKLHRRAKAMQRRVDRYESGMVAELDSPERSLRFEFDCDESGTIVLSAEHLTKSFGDRKLFGDLDLELRQGERVALVGPNGAGKTTLLKMLLGNLPSDDPRGVVRTGARVRLGYYDQELAGVDGEKTLFEELLTRMGDVEAHNALGRFMFPYDAQFKRVSDLSGGERARLALLNLTLGRHNLLVLDEPTNHLDVEMIEALEDALDAYEGTLLLVSHDRRFLETLAETVWEVRDGKLIRYHGDWSFYRRKQAANKSANDQVLAAQTSQSKRQAEATKSDKAAGTSRWQLERRLAELEKSIAAVEATLKELSEQLAAPDELDEATIKRFQIRPGPPPSQGEVMAGLGAEHARREDELLKLMEEWHQVSERLTAA